MKRSLPWIIVTIFIVYVSASILWPASSARRFDLERFGRLPIALNGRVQPIDSAARRALLQIRGTVTVPEDVDGRWGQWWKSPVGVSATEWLLDVLARPDVADTRNIFRVDDAAVRRVALAAPTGARYASFKDLQPRVKEIGEEVARAWKVKATDRAPSDRAWLKLRDDLVLYERLKNTLQPNSFLQGRAAGTPVVYDFGEQLATYTEALRTAITARRAGKQEVLDKPTEETVLSFVRPYVAVSRTALLSLVPAPGERGDGRWTNAGTALVVSSRTGTFPAALSFLARMGGAYANGRVDDFNRELSNYEKWLATVGLTAERRKARTESFYNRFQPLVKAIAIYVVALGIGVVAIRRRSASMYRSSAALFAFAAALHATGILFDMMLQGTLPVTNVYSAIVCGGFISVLVGGLLEARLRNGLAASAAAVFGVCALTAAHAMTPGGTRALAGAVFDRTFVIAAIAAVATLAVQSLGPRYRPFAVDAERTPRWHEVAQG